MMVQKQIHVELKIFHLGPKKKSFLNVAWVHCVILTIFLYTQQQLIKNTCLKFLLLLRISIYHFFKLPLPKLQDRTLKKQINSHNWVNTKTNNVNSMFFVYFCSSKSWIYRFKSVLSYSNLGVQQLFKCLCKVTRNSGPFFLALEGASRPSSKLIVNMLSLCTS